MINDAAFSDKPLSPTRSVASGGAAPHLKRCPRCATEKPLDEYSPLLAARDGRHAICKCCRRAYFRDYYWADPEREKRRAKEWRREHPERHKQIAKRSRDPVKEAARVLLCSAVRSGRLVRQPCAVCGRVMVEGHHEDYTKPLVVTWLCRRCHKRLHRMPDGVGAKTDGVHSPTAQDS